MDVVHATLPGQSYSGLQRYSRVGTRNLRTARDIRRQPTDPEDARWFVHLGTAFLGSWRIALDVVTESGISQGPEGRASRHKDQTVQEVLRTFGA